MPTLSASQTPSSAGDIDAAGPTSLPEAAPLSRRSNIDDDIARSHTEVLHEHHDSFLHPSHLAHQPAEMSTIQPYALTAGNLDESPPGSIRLGPSEFAITFPMDARVKDDYERVLTHGAPIMRKFLASFSPSSNISDHEVSCVYLFQKTAISNLTTA